MTQYQFVYGVDQSATPPGTNANAALVNALTFAQSSLVSGGIPSTNGTLTLTQPATTIVYNDGSATLQTVVKTSQGLTFTASKDTYVDLSSSGTYTQVAVANGATAPGVTASSLRLYKAVSNGSSVTSVTQLATNAAVNPLNVTAPDESTTNNPTVAATDTLQQTIWRILYKIQSGLSGILQTGVTYDGTEAAASTGSSSLLDNLNHLRKAVQNLTGLTWTTILNQSAGLDRKSVV